jgi:hypothetical protein
MSEDVTSPPNFIFKKPNGGRKKEECIVDLVASSAAGVGRIGLAAAVDSSAGCVSVMIFRINKELVSQGWKISSTKLNGQPGRRGAPALPPTEFQNRNRHPPRSNARAKFGASLGAASRARGNDTTYVNATSPPPRFHRLVKTENRHCPAT